MKRRSLCVALLAMTVACGLLFSLGRTAQAAKDRVVVAFGSNIPTLDPHMHSSRLAHIADYHLYDTLLYRSPKDNYKPGLGLATFPGIAIFFTTLGVNLFGDGLRDVLDPHQY